MAALYGNKAAQLGTVGFVVVRAAALLPQSATAAIFNVNNGKVLITGLVGHCAVLSPATVNTLKLTGTPTVGTAVDYCTAVSVASKEAGSLIGLPNPVAAGSSLVVGNAGTPITNPDGFVAQAGTITLTTSGSAATGTWDWTLSYIPLDPTASVSAA